jgi:hypothetical protein
MGLSSPRTVTILPKLKFGVPEAVSNIDLRVCSFDGHALASICLLEKGFA